MSLAYPHIFYFENKLFVVVVLVKSNLNVLVYLDINHLNSILYANCKLRKLGFCLFRPLLNFPNGHVTRFHKVVHGFPKQTSMAVSKKTNASGAVR